MDRVSILKEDQGQQQAWDTESGYRSLINHLLVHLTKVRSISSAVVSGVKDSVEKKAALLP